MKVTAQKFKKRLEVLFKNIGYVVESSLIYQDLIILDMEFATTHDKVNVIYVGDLNTYKKFKEDIKEYEKNNTVVLFDKPVAKKAVPYKTWALSELADIEKCGYLGCMAVPSSLLFKK
jgi:hypothetical protein